MRKAPLWPNEHKVGKEKEGIPGLTCELQLGQYLSSSVENFGLLPSYLERNERKTMVNKVLCGKERETYIRCTIRHDIFLSDTLYRVAACHLQWGASSLTYSPGELGCPGVCRGQWQDRACVLTAGVSVWWVPHTRSHCCWSEHSEAACSFYPPCETERRSGRSSVVVWCGAHIKVSTDTWMGDGMGWGQYAYYFILLTCKKDI